MWLCWSIMIPIGFLWARFVKGYPDDKSGMWFEGHRLMMSISFIIVLISAAYAISLTTNHLGTVHKIMGAAVVLAALYQVMSAVLRPHADPHNPTCQRLIFEYTHHTVGRLAILLSWVAIAYGLVSVTGISMTVVYIHIVISGIWIFIYFGLEIRKLMITRRNRNYEQIRNSK